MVKDDRIQTTFRIDQELLKRFRHALVDREQKMTPLIEALIRKWLQEAETGQRETTPRKMAETVQPVQKAPALLPPPAPPEPPIKPTADNPWKRILDYLSTRVPQGEFEHWFHRMSFGRVDGRTLYVVVPSFAFSSVSEQYGELLREAITQLRLDLDQIELVVSFLDGENLNPRYTFETFVAQAGNQFAYAAAEAVAENPSRAYNPLFLYGGVGMGKTHLLHAIGNEIRRRNPQSAVCYLSAERFTNELINALRYDRMNTFREQLRGLDVLLIDDIEFMAQKERTQEEFFHTFNALYEAKRQIVIASDRPPKELRAIEDRLRSRFECGLIADIQTADLETKVAILKKKAESEQVQLPTDVALFIASNLRSNVRELEGALIRLIAHSALMDREISLPYAQQVLQRYIDDLHRPKVTIELIQKAVAEQFGLRIRELRSNNNSRPIVYPRQIAMYLSKKLTEVSLPEIGRQFGGKHSTTVLHSVRKIERLRKIDSDLNKLILIVGKIVAE
jgi:chromosomal replication initiator protein